MAYGSTLRALHIGRLLKQCGEVSLILMPLGNIENASLEQTKLEFDLKGVVHFHFEPSPPRTVFERSKCRSPIMEGPTRKAKR
jgi:hypothetical protein